MRITVRGLIEPMTGFGQITIYIIAGLLKRGVHVHAIPLRSNEGGDHADYIRQCMESEPGDVELLIAPLDQCIQVGEKPTFYFTMWETDRISKKQVDTLNRAKAVITPSKWNRGVFEVCGVNRPVHIVPLGVDLNVFNVVFPLPEKFTIGTGGRTKHSAERKNCGLLIEAFKEAFHGVDDVALRIKTDPEHPIQSTDPRIVVDGHYMTEDQLVQWYGKISVFVSSSMGEGWGLMTHQAMACGRPVAHVPFGGVTEFMNCRVGYFMESDYPLVNFKNPSVSPARVGPPTKESLIATLREMYEDRESLNRRGEAAVKRASEFPWDRTVDELVALL